MITWNARMILIELVRAAKRTSSKGKGHCRTSVGDTILRSMEKGQNLECDNGTGTRADVDKKEY